ncbi:MAG: sigma-70 family RNA polymerase sigma factor [Planctomycetota bacterium]
MAASPDTQPSLLVKIRDQRDGDSWSRFVAIYAPAIYGFLQQQNLQEADAADLTQDVLSSVAVAIKSFDYHPKRGRFRGWLFTIVQNRLRNHWRSIANHPDARGDTAAYQRLLEQPNGERDAAEQWNHEYEHRLFVSAAEQIRPEVQESTWQAFWSTVVDGESTATVAQRLGMSPAAVRLAKARVITRIKRAVQLIDGESE